MNCDCITQINEKPANIRVTFCLFCAASAAEEEEKAEGRTTEDETTTRPRR